MEDNKEVTTEVKKDGIVKTRLAKLIDVKSIMTLALTGAFVYLTAQGSIDGEKYLSIYTVVISFFFGTKIAKNTDANKGE